MDKWPDIETSGCTGVIQHCILKGVGIQGGLPAIVHWVSKIKTPFQLTIYNCQPQINQVNWIVFLILKNMLFIHQLLAVIDCKSIKINF